MTRVPSRYRGAPRPAQAVDDAGQPVTFATPGAPTREELRRYAQAVAPPAPAPATRARQEEVAAIHARRRELFPHLYND